MPEQTLERLGAAAGELERELWITEGGWDFQLWQRSEELPSWDNALNLATNYSRVLKSARATTLLYWQMSGNDYNLNDGLRAYPSLEILAQYAAAFPPGSQVVGTSPDQITLYSVAAQGPGAHFALHLVNKDRRTQPVWVEGLPAGTYQHILSSKEFPVPWQAGQTRVQAQGEGRVAQVSVPGRGVTVLVRIPEDFQHPSEIFSMPCTIRSAGDKP